MKWHMIAMCMEASAGPSHLQASPNRRLNCCIPVNVQTQANVFYRGVFVESCVMVEKYVTMSFIASLKSIT